jgi:hypothetical protein
VKASSGSVARRNIQIADYEGDRPELGRLAAALDDVNDARLLADRSYWRGFAHWRRALNGFGESPAPADLASDLEDAVRHFRAALAERPAWIEAKVGIVGAQSNLLFLARGDAEATRKIGSWAESSLARRRPTGVTWRRRRPRSRAASRRPAARHERTRGRPSTHLPGVPRRT